jgi:cyclopropane-fatty-acyl-phospholipid synthase
VIETDERAARSTFDALRELLADYSPRDFAVRLWDGTTWSPDDGYDARFTLVLSQPGALRAFVGTPSELALAEAYIRGAIDFEGDLEAIFEVADHILVGRRPNARATLRHARRVRHVPPLREVDGRAPARLRGRPLSLGRTRAAARYHYDLSNEFFALFLDPALLYSCAYFERPDESVDLAQERKVDYVCRKLRLRPGERLLDVGCGWGGLSVHAAQRYGAQVLAITVSEEQARFARDRVERETLSERVRVEVRDYRELDDGWRFDKVASIGMFEHVPEKALRDYFERVHRLLRPGGVFLNHGITRPIDQAPRRGPSFMLSYVYPDAELKPLSTTLRAAELAGFEVRDVESLREHYVPTLRQWLARLEAEREGAVRLVGEVAFRIFRLYLAGSIYGFRTGRVNVHQALLTKPHADGSTELPLQRADWYA